MQLRVGVGFAMAVEREQILWHHQEPGIQKYGRWLNVDAVNLCNSSQVNTGQGVSCWLPSDICGSPERPSFAVNMHEMVLTQPA